MTARRYIGLDFHKRHVMVAAVNAQQELLLKPMKVPVQCFELRAASNLRSDDYMSLEATSNAWTFYDLLETKVANVFAANTYKLKLISSSASKTDRQDAMIPAKLLAANLYQPFGFPHKLYAIYTN